MPPVLASSDSLCDLGLSDQIHVPLCISQMLASMEIIHCHKQNDMTRERLQLDLHIIVI